MYIPTAQIEKISQGNLAELIIKLVKSVDLQNSQNKENTNIKQGEVLDCDGNIVML